MYLGLSIVAPSYLWYSNHICTDVSVENYLKLLAENSSIPEKGSSMELEVLDRVL